MKQTYQTTTEQAETAILGENNGMVGFMNVTCVCVGADLLVDVGEQPDAAANGGVVPAGVPFNLSVIPGQWKASFKTISGTGWVTFYY